jgi:hypothetical protein
VRSRNSRKRRRKQLENGRCAHRVNEGGMSKKLRVTIKKACCPLTTLYSFLASAHLDILQVYCRFKIPIDPDFTPQSISIFYL